MPCFVPSRTVGLEEGSMKRLGWRRWLILIAFLSAASASADLQNFTVP
jgi:hypothetical protein